MGPLGGPETSVKITTIICVMTQKSGVLLTPEDGTNRWSRNVGKNYHYYLCNDPEEWSSLDP